MLISLWMCNLCEDGEGMAIKAIHIKIVTNCKNNCVSGLLHTAL